jgi:hypothetical protein
LVGEPIVAPGFGGGEWPALPLPREGELDESIFRRLFTLE